MADTKKSRSKSSWPRMSTGGKAPAKSVYIDDEAEDGDSEEENQDDYDFIDDGVVDDEQSIVWSRTASPVEPAIPVEISSASATATNKRLPDVTTPLTTRSRAKHNSKARSSLGGGSTAQPAESLNTTGYKNSRSDKALGKRFSSVVLGKEAPDDQRELEVMKSSVKRKTMIVDADEWQKFKEYQASLDADRETTTLPLASPITIKSESRTPSKPAVSGKKVDFTLATEDLIDTPPVTPGKPRVSKETHTPKRKHIHTVVSDDDTFAAPVEAFNALRGKRKKLSVSSVSEEPEEKRPRAEISPSATATLQTTTVKKPHAAPKKCQVMDATLQDDLLKRIYDKGLPKLLSGAFYSWSSRKGVGMYMFSNLADDNPGVDIQSVWSFVNFVQRGRYINLARIVPGKLEAVSQLITKDTNRWTLSIKGQTATCVSVVNTVKSSLQQISSVNKSRLTTVPLLKYVTGVHLSQEFDRVVGVCRMVFHHKGMHAQLNEDELTFGTKSTTADKLGDSRKPRAGGVQSSSTRYKGPTSYNSSSDALDIDAEIPLYDGRGATINAAEDIDNLDDILPRYQDNDGEIPNNSCTAVAYTVTQWNRNGEENISFNIKWAVVLGQPN